MIIIETTLYVTLPITINQLKRSFFGFASLAKQYYSKNKLLSILYDDDVSQAIA